MECRIRVRTSEETERAREGERERKRESKEVILTNTCNKSFLGLFKIWVSITQLVLVKPASGVGQGIL